MNDPSQLNEMATAGKKEDQTFANFSDLPVELRDHVTAFSEQSVENLRMVGRNFKRSADADPIERRVRQTATELAKLYGDRAFGGPWEANKRFTHAPDPETFIDNTTHLLKRIEPLRQILPKDHNLRKVAGFVVSHIEWSDPTSARETPVMRMSKLGSHLRDVFQHQQHFAIDIASTRLDRSAYRNRRYNPQGFKKPFTNEDVAAAKVLWHLRGEVNDVSKKGSPYREYGNLQNKISMLTADPDTKSFMEKEFHKLQVAQEKRRELRNERLQQLSLNMPNIQAIENRIEEVFKDTNYWDGQRSRRDAYTSQKRDVADIIEDIWDVRMSGPHQRLVNASKELSNETRRSVVNQRDARTDMIASRSQAPSSLER
ncbi:hypothetical protein [Agrobacterium tumefaciens]|nr:hypothetical protein [Agrobacterium tumefaciens]